MQVYLRADRGVLKVAGPDAQKLLNSVLTAEVKAEDGPAHWWALLSPQGKIQAEGLIGWADGAFWLDVHESVFDTFSKKMRLYKLRAQVELEDCRETHAVGWSPDTGVPGIVHADTRAEGLGARVIAPKAEAAIWERSDEPQARARIAAGVLELGQDFEADSAFPHDIGMDLLSGIDFAKGCYVGQEVVSRMKHRGTARRRPVLVSGEVAGGGALVAGSREAGRLGRAVDGHAVAIARLDRFGEGVETRVGDTPVTLALPSWASYRFEESADESAST